MEKSMNLITMFPLCVYQEELEEPQVELMLKYAKEYNGNTITSDISGDSYYQNNPDFDTFFKQVTYHVKEYCKILGYKTDMFDFYVTRSWINNFDNAKNTISNHTHTPSDISICYYPDDSENPICFENTNKPNEVLENSFIHNELFKERNDFSCSYVFVKPQKNNLLIFPSKAHHWVDRINQNEHRVSFSADFIMVLKEGITTSEHIRNPINTWRKF